jgi:hypothetical protein
MEPINQFLEYREAVAVKAAITMPDRMLGGWNDLKPWNIWRGVGREFGGGEGKSMFGEASVVDWIQCGLPVQLIEMDME